MISQGLNTYSGIPNPYEPLLAQSSLEELHQLKARVCASRLNRNNPHRNSSLTHIARICDMIEERILALEQAEDFIIVDQYSPSINLADTSFQEEPSKHNFELLAFECMLVKRNTRRSHPTESTLPVQAIKMLMHELQIMKNNKKNLPYSEVSTFIDYIENIKVRFPQADIAHVLLEAKKLLRQTRRH